MSGMFEHSSYQGDISKWNTSNVTNMQQMFYNSAFDGDISLWNVEQVQSMNSMFRDAAFRGDISQWKLTSLSDASHAFSTFHPSMLGYIAMLQVYEDDDGEIDIHRYSINGESMIPSNLRGSFMKLLSMCHALDLNVFEAAAHIYQQVHLQEQTISPELLDIPGNLHG